MHTKTAASVLRPLADAVTALILIISDSEITETPTPDLTKLSQAVDSQIKNLVNVARKIMDQVGADPILKNSMPSACNHVLHASALLISSSSELLLTPTSSKGRCDLLEAIKGIFDGTTDILNVFDDSEISKIQKACEKVRNLLSDLEFMDRKSSGHATYLQKIKLIQQNHVTCLQLSTKRIKEMLSDKLVSELQDALECATKECSFFMASTKFALQWPDSAEAFEAQKASRTKLTTDLFRIERAVSSNGDENVPSILRESILRIIEPYAKYKNILTAKAFSEQWKESAEDTRNNVNSFLSAAKEKLHQKNEAMTFLSSPSFLDFPERVISQVTPYFSLLNDLEDDATLSLNEAKCDQDSKELINAIDSGITAIDSNLSMGIISELIGLLGEMSDPSNVQTITGLLNDAIIKKDIGKISKLSAMFDKNAQKIHKLVNYVLQKMPKTYPDYEPVFLFNQRAENCIPAVVSTAKLYEKHTEEQVAQHLTNSLFLHADAVMEIKKKLVSYEGVFKTDELIFGAHHLFERHSNNFNSFLAEKNSEGALSAASGAAIAANQLLSIMEREKDNTEDSDYKAQLEKGLPLIRSTIPQIISKKNDLHVHIGHTNEQDIVELNKIISAFSRSTFEYGKVVQHYKGVTQSSISLPSVNLWQAPPPTEKKDEVKIAEDAKSVEFESAEEAKTPNEVKLGEEPPLPKSELEIGLDLQKISLSPDTQPHQITIESLSEEEQARLLAAAAADHDDQLKGLTHAIKDVVIVMEEAPHLLSVLEAEEDPMKAAGQELKVEASHWDAEHNLIVSKVNGIGELFLLLSSHHKELSRFNNPQSKKIFIQTAQEILSETVKLVKAVEPFIKACADKRLAMQINQTVTRTSTFAQTLKIVAAVKASSPRDNDKGVQLISNAQNLMHSVKNILRDTISCSLRLKKDAPSDLIHFKKVIYAKGYIKTPVAKTF